MVSLPGIDTYPVEHLETIRRLSPAFARLERLLAEPTIDDLHSRRHRAWMECALAGFFGTATTADVCSYWSATADAVLREASRRCGLDDAGAAVIALGKLGAGELNLSSDIDLILVAEPEHAAAAEKALRGLQRLLGQSGEFGFCFRLDFDLRPGGKLGPLITTPAQFQDYYWSQGEMWERLALVRLRPVTGPAALTAQIEDLARRYSFRKFLDFTLLDDLKALRSEVHRRGFQRREGELNLKLEIGGIRDIELFVHSLLVLNGGKLPELRTRSTPEALSRLAAKKLLPADEARVLTESYWRLRHVENLVQSVDDRQTHALTGAHGALPGLPDRAEIAARMTDVDRIVSSLLGRVDTDKTRLPAGEDAQVLWLTELGFSAEAIERHWRPLIKATALSHKNDRDERARQEFLFSFTTELAKHRGADADLGLSLLLDFVRATRGKATFFTMLLRSPRLIEDLARLFRQSPYLGSILASRPELLDHFILQVDEAWSTDTAALLGQMAERKLLTEIWSANQYLADGDLPVMFERVSSTADEICLALLAQLKREFPAARLEILALGKWGGRELGLRSDLDFIFVTPLAPGEDDFKAARRFISRLTDPLKGGHLYDIDLRLRPSGRSGPLLVSEEQLFAYWRGEAQAWERQAYLRARRLAAGAPLPLEAFVERGLSGEDLSELKRIRAKLLQAASVDAGAIDLKHVPGGLIDIEFTVQTAVLAAGAQPAGARRTASASAEPAPAISGPATSTRGMIDALSAADPAWASAAGRIKEIYLDIRRLEQMLQLASARKISAVERDSAAFIKAAALTGTDAATAWARLLAVTREARDHLNALDPTGFKI